MKLSKHFSLNEMTTTSYDVDNTPTKEDLERLIYFCENFMEPVRNKFGPIRVHSGYRSKTLNAAIPGSAKKSAHCFGCACDFTAYDPAVSVRDIVKWIVNESNLPYDQVIDECKGGSPWVHLGMLRPGYQHKPRKQWI